MLANAGTQSSDLRDESFTIEIDQVFVDVTPPATTLRNGCTKPPDYDVIAAIVAGRSGNPNCFLRVTKCLGFVEG